MAIKPTGPGRTAPATTAPATTGPASTRSVVGTPSARFDAPQAASTVQGSAPAKAPMQAIAAQVATEVKQGEVAPEDAYDLVIERAVAQELPEASATVRSQKVLEAQLLLAENPVFREQLRIVFRGSGVVLPD